MERRRQKRHEVRYPVRLSGDPAPGEGLMLNLSTRGCAIRTALDIEDGSYWTTLLIHPALSMIPIKIEGAAVRWTKDHNLGLEFVRLDAGQRERLLELIAVLAMGPEPVLANP